MKQEHLECEEFKERVFMTVTGLITASLSAPEAKNLYARGEKCIELYGQVQDACERICQRLDVAENGGPSHPPKEDDKDLTRILNLMDEICELVGYEMFRCGAFFQQKVDSGEEIDLYPFAGEVSLE